MTAYVWNGSEVKLTGRIAKKEGKRTVSGRSGRGGFRSIDMLHEIEPADKQDGSWTKWVRKEELYEIVDEPNDTGETSEEIISFGEEGGDTDGEDSEQTDSSS